MQVVQNLRNSFWLFVVDVFHTYTVTNDIIENPNAECACRIVARHPTGPWDSFGRFLHECYVFQLPKNMNLTVGTV